MYLFMNELINELINLSWGKKKILIADWERERLKMSRSGKKYEREGDVEPESKKEENSLDPPESPRIYLPAGYYDRNTDRIPRANSSSPPQVLYVVHGICCMVYASR